MDDTPGRVRDDNVTPHAASTPGASSDDGGDVEAQTRELRQEIEQTREELAETVEAIQEKLTPRRLVASATDRVKNAATERVREMVDTASQTAQQAARQSPVPLALIGIGAAWLLARSQRQSSPRGYVEWREQRDYGREYGGEQTRDKTLYGDHDGHGLIARIRHNPIPAALAGVGLGWLALSGSSHSDDYIARGMSRHDVTSGESEGRSGQGISQTLADSAGHLTSRTREYASGTTDSMRRMMRRRQNQMQHMVQDNPLLVGAGALMLGVAFGMAVPESETENELMGDARDTMVERARELARDAAGQVQDAASSVADAAGQVVGKTRQ
jgi:hypothetical protein